MRKLIMLVLSLLIAGQFVKAQDNFMWLKLSDSRVVINGKFRQLSGDTLFITNGMKEFSLPLKEVVRIRVIQGGTIMEGALLGAGAGFGVGTAVGFLARSSGPDTQYPLGTALIFTVVGGVVGTIKTAFDKPEPIVDLYGKTNEEKRVIIEKLVAKNIAQ